MQRYFNTAGPCFPDEHYMLPALDRLPDVRGLVSRRQYFVIHAPRQTGKTTALQALAWEIYEKGDMIAVYCTLETIQKLVGSYEMAMREIRHLVLKSAGVFSELSPIAVGTGRLDLCVEFRGARYAVEVKTSDNFKGEKSYEQCAKYLDTLKPKRRS